MTVSTLPFNSKAGVSVDAVIGFMERQRFGKKSKASLIPIHRADLKDKLFSNTRTLYLDAWHFLPYCNVIPRDLPGSVTGNRYLVRGRKTIIDAVKKE